MEIVAGHALSDTLGVMQFATAQNRGCFVMWTMRGFLGNALCEDYNNGSRRITSPRRHIVTLAKHGTSFAWLTACRSEYGCCTTVFRSSAGRSPDLDRPKVRAWHRLEGRECLLFCSLRIPLVTTLPNVLQRSWLIQPVAQALDPAKVPGNNHLAGACSITPSCILRRER